MFSFHPAFPRGSRRRRSRGAADGRRPRARERRKKCSDRYTCYHTTRCPLGLGYKGALPGSCTPSTPSNSIQARVSRANDGKSTNRQGKKQAFHSARALAGETSDGASRARRARDDRRVSMRARERFSRSDTGIAPSPRGSRSSRRRRAATRDAAAAATNRQTRRRGASVANRRRRRRRAPHHLLASTAATSLNSSSSAPCSTSLPSALRFCAAKKRFTMAALTRVYARSALAYASEKR